MSGDPKKRVQAAMTRPENSRCADCLSKDPRWASSTLGVFICINCSGRHRNLGTHITFVRSCTLDSWTDEQAKVMELIGNANSNRYWEARLPANYPRPATDDLEGLTKFIRMKYELKKWVDPESDPPHEVLANGGQSRGKRRHRHAHEQKPEQPQSPPMSRSSSEPAMAGNNPQQAPLFAAQPPVQPSRRAYQSGVGSLQPPSPPQSFPQPPSPTKPQPASGGGLLDFDFDPMGTGMKGPSVSAQQQQGSNDRAALKALAQITPTGVGNTASLRQMMGAPQYGPARGPPVMNPPMGMRPPQQYNQGVRPPPPAKSASADPFGFPF